MAKTQKRIFNLLKPVEPPLTVWDKIYEWLVKRARVVVMLAEVFIAIAFFGKVIVDTEAKDKQENVNSLVAEAKLYTDENGVSGARRLKYTQLQSRDSDYQKLWNNSSNVGGILSEIYSYIPNESSDITINISANKVSIFGEVELSILQELEDQIDSSSNFLNSEITLTIEQDDAVAGIGTYVLEGTLSTEAITRSDLQ